MKKVFAQIVTVFSILLLPAVVSGQARPDVLDKVEVKKAVRQDVSRPLREMMPLPVKATRGGDYEPKRFGGGNASQSADTAVQSFTSPSIAITAGLNFEGVGEGLTGYNVNVAPPDTTGDVGATQYVQWVNLSFAVFNKSDGLLLYGPAAGNTLWSGFGGPCQDRNDGDPIVQYDQLANRWVMTQFAVPGGSAGYHQCVAVSTTSDATGAYARYDFLQPAFNDYPKLGVWPDAYYVTYNMFGTVSFQGARVCAMDRAKMILGQPATQQCVQLSTSFGGLLPSDLDGLTPPPVGSPNYVLNFGTNSLRLWKYHVDWVTPGNSTFTGPTSIPVASFSTACGGGTCVIQPSTRQKLDSLGDRLMYRLAYRNFGTFENLVVNHSVKVGTQQKNPYTGVRWYELHSNLNGVFSVFQQGTFAPDTNFRWMGSAAMDKVGNLAVGYSISSGTVRPSIRFAARSASDTPNTLGSETTVQTGTGSQLPNLERWGDYSTLSVDPSDDCTMWYTTEYLAADGTFNWHTRINSFKLQGCQ